MSSIHLKHIEKKLETDYFADINMSDCAGRRPADIDAARRSRALAAFALAERSGLTPEVAGAHVTDGFDDNGVDAIGIDSETSTVVIVQSKWAASGKGSPELGDIQKFAQGIRDLINARFDRFNAKVKAMAPELSVALENTDVRFDIVVAHTGTEKLSKHASSALSDLLDQINDVSETAMLTVLSQAELHGLVRLGALGPAPDLTVTLYDWGKTDEPYKAVYGQVDASDVAEWWSGHRSTLFERNLRKFQVDSSVNESMIQTLADQPTHFWYFNNGITCLCQRVAKAPLGGTGRKSGKFTFQGVQVVNGAQTVGSIGSAAERGVVSIEDARVYVRFISLEDCPDGFSTEVTRATNTQNRILARDFVALNAEQERLQAELRFEEGKSYSIKSGEPNPSRDEGCDVEEATIALACAYSLDLAVQAKREKGRLWQDVNQPPYTDLFNSTVSATRLWRAVEVLRLVDETLREEQDQLEGRDRLVAVHGNRLIAHLVFRKLPAGALDRPGDSFETTAATVPQLARDALAAVRSVVSTDYVNNYPASIFKNASRCREVMAKVTAPQRSAS